ncbi:hypothetical protein MMC30_005154 [Trapelia coarctata]|nr:hypothetical protein [Trapelia coarctata]
MAGIAPELAYPTRICLRLRHKPITQIRKYTTTPSRQKHGPLPTFAPTSSSELDALLSTFRTNIFLPSHLLRAQQNLIYKKTLQHHLTGEDLINVELPTSTSPTSKESFTLVPLDRFTDEPDTKASFHKLLDLMQAKSDWDVLPGFLEGLMGSKRKLKRDMAEKMVRRAGNAGRVGTIIECLRRTERTGLRVDNVALARVVMRGTLQTAIQSGWSEEGVTKAAKQAGVVMGLIEDPAHVPAEHQSKKIDPRRAPDVVAIAMALMAFKVLKVGEGARVGDLLQVEKYAKRVLRLWDNAELHFNTFTGEIKWVDASKGLLMWAPVVQGMRWAIRALGEQSETSKRLGKVLEADVEPSVEKTKQVVELAGGKEKMLGPMMFKEMQKAVV